MKVVLFCGGLGTRLREYSETTPKPLVPIGDRPIMWHLMRYYAYYGHTEFILCLGYKGYMIKEYFMNYREWESNDFRMVHGRDDIELFNRDVDGWDITFVDTGMASNIGERLMSIRHLLEGEDEFLANYSDGLSDVDLPRQIRHFRAAGAMGSFAAMRPSQTFHTVQCDDDGTVQRIGSARESGMRINGGFFVLNTGIFEYMRPGEELVEEPFQRLIAENRLVGYRHDGFFGAMDTFRDKRRFDDMHDRDERPWEVWNPPRCRPPEAAAAARQPVPEAVTLAKRQTA